MTSALLRVGMEEETEDVALEFFAVTWAESGAVTPDISDAGDAWDGVVLTDGCTGKSGLGILEE